LWYSVSGLPWFREWLGRDLGIVGVQRSWHGSNSIKEYSISNDEKLRERFPQSDLYLFIHQFRAENVSCIVRVQYQFYRVCECRAVVDTTTQNTLVALSSVLIDLLLSFDLSIEYSEEHRLSHTMICQSYSILISSPLLCSRPPPNKSYTPWK